MDIGPLDALWLAAALVTASVIRWVLLGLYLRVLSSAARRRIDELREPPAPEPDPTREYVRSRLREEPTNGS